MNSNFCKIFQIDDNHQVLYHLIVVDNEETNENETAIEIKTFINRLQMVAKISGFKNEIAEEKIETITIQQAINFFNQMNSLTK